MQQITYRPIVTLHKLPGNPRLIRDKAFQTLRKSLADNADYFEARPLILSNRTGQLVIIAGNQRYEAAKANGLDEIPTILLPDLTEAREREIIIRDNVNNGEWDTETLANGWDQDNLADWGVDVPVFVEEPDLDGLFINDDHELIKAGKLVLAFSTEVEAEHVKKHLLEHGKTCEVALKALLGL